MNDQDELKMSKDLAMFETKLDVLVSGLQDLHKAVKELDACFDRFKENIGSRIQGTEREVGDSKIALGVLKSEVAMILWVLRGVATPILGAVGISVMGFLVWHFAKG